MLAEFLLDPAQPVQLLFLVKQEVQEHQQQEGAAESCHLGMRMGQVGGIHVGRGGRHAPHLDQPQPGGHRDDQQREQQPHAEYRDHDADAQEQLLPERVPVAQHGGVDHRIVKR